MKKLSSLNIVLILSVFLAGASFAAASDTPSFKVPRDAALATFAGGCFWCMEPPFEELQGVEAVISGYTGGHQKNPTYKQVSRGETGHVEAIQVHYIPSKIRYEDLLEVFWRSIDPTDARGQFVDRGSQYTTAIFYHDDTQKQAALKSKEKLERSGRFNKKIVTPIRAAEEFYPAEQYHQDFYKKSKIRYKTYRYHSGRDQFLERTWGMDRFYVPKPAAAHMPDKISMRSVMKIADNYSKPSKEEIKKKLTALQYRVTQKNGTEPPFKNDYWNNKQPGIYVDIVSGEPLFSSRDKFDSGTGWPSFTRPLEPDNVVTHEDYSLFMKRIEVRSRHGDSHLGHVFDDGPMPTRKRYCINSASLRFVPASRLAQEGYGQYASLFGVEN